MGSLFLVMQGIDCNGFQMSMIFLILTLISFTFYFHLRLVFLKLLKS